jgi:hypothetical protein
MSLRRTVPAAVDVVAEAPLGAYLVLQTGTGEGLCQGKGSGDVSQPLPIRMLQIALQRVIYVRVPG